MNSCLNDVGIRKTIEAGNMGYGQANKSHPIITIWICLASKVEQGCIFVVKVFIFCLKQENKLS